MVAALLLIASLVVIFTIKLTQATVTDTVVNPEIIEAVNSYLTASSRLDRDEACKNLTGEALYNANRNLRLIENPATLKINKVSLLSFNDNIAVIEADYLLTTDGITDLAKDRFYLVKQEGWKIYRQETLPLFIEESLNCEENETTRMAKRVVSDYIGYVAGGEYRSAVQLLTGKELEAAIKFLDMKPLKQDLLVKDFKVLALGESTAFLEAQLESENRVTSSLFELIFIDGWKINKVSNL